MKLTNASIDRLTNGPFRVWNYYPKFRICWPEQRPAWMNIIYRDTNEWKELLPQEQEWRSLHWASVEPPFTPIHSCSDCQHDYWADK